MAQVVTHENMQELIQQGHVADFVAPKPEGETPKVEPKAETPSGEAPKDTKPAAEPQPVAEAAEEPKKLEAVADELPEKVQKRINEKHRQMKEAEEWGKAQYLEKLAAEKRVGELEAKVSEFEKSKAPALPKEQAEAPKQEDYTTVAEFIDAQVEWKLKQKEAEQVANAKKTAEAQLQAEHVKRVQAFAESHPDYDEVINKADLTLSMPLIQYIRESEMGPVLAYHLSENAVNGGDVAERLNRLSPIKALAEMGKLEAKLAPAEKSDDAQPKPKAAQTQTSRAPAPITPIDGKKEPAHKDPATMSFKELREHNEAQRRLKASQTR